MSLFIYPIVLTREQYRNATTSSVVTPFKLCQYAMSPFMYLFCLNDFQHMPRRIEKDGVPRNVMGDSRHNVHDGHESSQSLLYGLSYRIVYIPLARD